MVAVLAGIDPDHADLEAGAGFIGAGDDDILAPGAQEVARRVELLDAIVVAVGDVDVAVAVGGGAGRKEHLAGSLVRLLPGLAGIAISRHADLRTRARAARAGDSNVLAPGPVERSGGAPSGRGEAEEGQAEAGADAGAVREAKLLGHASPRSRSSAGRLRRSPEATA